MPVEETQDESVDHLQPVSIKPMQMKDVGVYAPFEISPEDMYGPDELGPDLSSVVKSLAANSGKYEDAARIWELAQATEARMFDRGYQYLLPSGKGGGWEVAGTQNKVTGTASIAVQDKERLWPLNVYGARKDKIVAALTKKVPEVEFFPKNPDSTALDVRGAEEANRYKHLWKQATNTRGLMIRTGGLFYTDDRVAYVTEAIQDAARFGMDGNTPGIGEITRAYGKLEFRVPMSVDEDEPLPWCERYRELDIAVAKEKYVWIERKIFGGAGTNDSWGRSCRLMVRNAVPNQTGTAGTSGATDRAITERTIWFRVSQFRDIVDDKQRKMFREMFPRGMRAVFVGDELAYIRNESMDDCVVIMYSRDGTGQNRRAIGSNNITTQKTLNFQYKRQNQFLSLVPRRGHNQEMITAEAINNRAQDDFGSIAIAGLQDGKPIESAFGTEKIPTAPDQLWPSIEAHVEVIPAEMDGAGPSMFGGTDGTDTATGITIQRVAGLQVFGTPYYAISWGMARAAGQAAKWAGKVRSGKVSSLIPGVGRVSVDMDSLGGETYCFPEAGSSYPESEEESEQRLMEAIDASANLPELQTILTDPVNALAIDKTTKRFGVRDPRANSVRKQQEEFEKLLKSVPIPNPQQLEASEQFAQLQEQAQIDPEAQTPEGQQTLQQAQQAVAAIPPLLPSVEVEQDASVNHSVEAAICFEKINSAEGQKLKREQKDVFKNLMLHWQGHVDMAEKLAPPQAPQVRPSVTMAADKLPAEAKAAVLSKEYGIDLKPEQLDTETDVHEVTEEKEGVDAQGVPVKHTISFSGKPLT